MSSLKQDKRDERLRMTLVYAPSGKLLCAESGHKLVTKHDTEDDAQFLGRAKQELED